MRSRSKAEKSQLLFKKDHTEAESNANDVKHINGIYFCQRCSNIIAPYKANGMILEFYCQTCGIRTVNFANSHQQQCMISNKQFQVVAKKVMPNPIIVFDPTIPRLNVVCPQCDYGQAAYMIITDQKEDRLIAKMFCLSITGNQIKCGNIWELDSLEIIQGDYDPLPPQKFKPTEEIQQSNNIFHKKAPIISTVPIKMILSQNKQLQARQTPSLKINLNFGSKMLFS